jgi:hypothetical protein
MVSSYKKRLTGWQRMWFNQVLEDSERR